MKCIFTIVIFLTFSPLLHGSLTKEALDRIPLKDKIYMRYFAKRFIESNHASHVLFFDNKPICSGGAILYGRDKRFKDVLSEKGWNAFKKHEHFFPHPNFIFEETTVESTGWCGRSKLLGILIINKKSLAMCLNEHQKRFKEVLGNSFDTSAFIEALENGKTLNALINQDEMLLGILLGYGEESARNFKNAPDDHPETYPLWRADYCGIEFKTPKGCRIYPIVFMGNPHSMEVKKLAVKYEKELEIFWHLYKNADPLAIFMQGLCKDS